MLNENQRKLFENLKIIKDYWTNESVKNLDPLSDIEMNDNITEIRLLQTKLTLSEEIEAFRKI